jgi:transcriptional regulator with XRE-family HTH domain
MKNISNPTPDFFLKQNSVTNRYVRIKSIMLDRGHRTIQDFANELGVSRSLISLIMHSHKEPSPTMKLQMAKALNVDSRIIFPDDDKK